MAMSMHRILKRHRRLVLVETANPDLGIGYSVRDGSLGVWAGDNLADAEQQFSQIARDARG